LKLDGSVIKSTSNTFVDHMVYHILYLACILAAVYARYLNEGIILATNLLNFNC